MTDQSATKNPDEHVLPAVTTSLDHAAPRQNPLVSVDKLKRLYAIMLKLRLIAQGRNNRLGTEKRRLHSIEACEAAVLIELRKGDTVAPLLHRSVGALGDKISLTDLVENRRSRQDCEPFVLTAGSDRVSIAAGVAFAQRAQNKDNVVIAFANAKELAGARESLTLAAAQSLPLIVVVPEEFRRNGIDRKRHTATKAIRTIPVDGNDVVAVYRVVFELIDKARRGAGPTVIHCMRVPAQRGHRYRQDPHCADPIAYMMHYLKKRNLWSDDLKRDIRKEVIHLLDKGFAAPRSRTASGSRDTR